MDDDIKKLDKSFFKSNNPEKIKSLFKSLASYIITDPLEEYPVLFSGNASDDIKESSLPRNFFSGMVIVICCPRYPTLLYATPKYPPSFEPLRPPTP